MTGFNSQRLLQDREVIFNPFLVRKLVIEVSNQEENFGEIFCRHA
jgi:hypothetical protein